MYCFSTFSRLLRLHTSSSCTSPKLDRYTLLIDVGRSQKKDRTVVHRPLPSLPGAWSFLETSFAHRSTTNKCHRGRRRQFSIPRSCTKEHRSSIFYSTTQTRSVVFTISAPSWVRVWVLRTIPAFLELTDIAFTIRKALTSTQ